MKFIVIVSYALLIICAALSFNVSTTYKDYLPMPEFYIGMAWSLINYSMCVLMMGWAIARHMSRRTTMLSKLTF